LRHNLTLVRSLCPTSKVMAMVKADAYGHGLLPVAAALRDADGLAVARLDEALQLRRAGITTRILLLGSLLDTDDLALCAQQNIDVTAHDMATVQRIAANARRETLRVWLKLDSGMHRLGLAPAEFAIADRLLRNTPGITELLHLTHLSSADDLTVDTTERQLSAFTTAHDAADIARATAASVANSAALIARANARSEWVRPGIMLYGENPLALTHALPLRPVMTLNTHVIALRRLPAGAAVGYNGTWTSARESVIATLGIGYGDGYPRHAKNGTPVWIDGRIVPLVGRVSMDSISIDVTDCNAVAVGDEAQLWGPQLSASTVATFAETISYELFTSIGSRVPRTYVGD
ncbi:MAG TPA: alanine racemase, partial [Spongiibacteraceae bacterium]|nr:alanine racemase [Spongiibacteraceae bacterium]